LDIILISVKKTCHRWLVVFSSNSFGFSAQKSRPTRFLRPTPIIWLKHAGFCEEWQKNTLLLCEKLTRKTLFSPDFVSAKQLSKRNWFASFPGLTFNF
jgi:hypothetical protein